MTNLTKDDLSLPLITTIKSIKAHWAGKQDSILPLEPFPCLGILFHVSLIKLPFILLAPCCSFLILGNCILAPQVKPTKKKTPFYENSWIKLRNSTFMLLYTKPKVFVLSLSFGSVDHL